MARIILEDMRVNNRKKQTILKKEVISPIAPIQKKKDFYKEEEKREKEVERIKEEKINEYFKNKDNSKQRIERTPRIKQRSKIIHRPVLIILTICIIGLGIYFGGNILEKANINITLKHQQITYKDKQFIASKDQTGNPINFEIMIVSDKKVKNVILTESKEVSEKAKGSITLFNEFSTTPLKIAAGSFVSDSDGKAYKLDNEVTIPGYKLDSNKKTILGQATVNITSFLPGDSYNGSPINFYISSFKGTPKYNKVYGKLKSPLVGGAQGLVYILNDANKSSVDSTIKSSLKEDLFRQVKAQVPPGYLLYPDALTFSYKINENVLSKTPEAKVEVEGLLSVVLLKEQSLIDNIIKTSLPNVSRDDELKEIKIPDVSDLSFSFVDKNQLITKEMETVSFLLKGNVDAIWNPDTEALKTKLVGVHKNNVTSIFKQDPGISSAVVKITPLWQSYIPDDLSRINIITK